MSGSDESSTPTSPDDDDLAWLNRHGHNRAQVNAGIDRAHRSRNLGRVPRSSRSRRRRRRRKKSRKVHHWYRPRNTVVLPLLVLVLVVAGFLFYVNHELGSIRRAPLNAAYAGKGSLGTNVLLIASNAPTTAVRADVATMVVQLVHIGTDGTHAALVDVPRDLVLPATADEARATVGVRYLRSDASGLSTALQDVFGITIEHVVQVTYAGYVKASDRLGGVDVSTGPGVEHFSGSQARAYVDEPGITSIEAGQRNQHWLRGIIEGMFTPGVLFNPFKVIGLLHDFTPSLVIDDAFTTGAMRSLGWHSRGLSPAQTLYLTVPHKDYVKVSDGVVLQPDLAGMRQLGAAIRADNESGIAVFDN